MAGRGRVRECERCGKELSAANMARHQRGCRWNSGGELSPLRGRLAETEQNQV